MDLLKNYDKALQDIYEYFGFVPDYVTLPIKDRTESYWCIDDEKIYYADSRQELVDDEGNYFESLIFKNDFYDKWIYEGEDFTMIFENTQTNGMRYFSIFPNSKRIVRSSDKKWYGISDYQAKGHVFNINEDID